jgi:predicted kinase
MNNPVLIIVHGKPGAGKSTLAKQLARDLSVHYMRKDDLKDFMFDQMGVGDRAWSTTLGRAASEMLYPLAEAILASGRPFIVESAFYKTLSDQRLQEIVETSKARCIQIYCDLESEERHRRFVERNEKGERHPGHVDALNYNASDDKTDSKTYAPLEVGTVWPIDTTHFGEPEYKVLLRRIAVFIEQKEG